MKTLRDHFLVKGKSVILQSPDPTNLWMCVRASSRSQGSVAILATKQPSSLSPQLPQVSMTKLVSCQTLHKFGPLHPVTDPSQCSVQLNWRRLLRPCLERVDACYNAPHNISLHGINWCNFYLAVMPFQCWEHTHGLTAFDKQCVN